MNGWLVLWRGGVMVIVVMVLMIMMVLMVVTTVMAVMGLTLRRNVKCPTRARLAANRATA